MILPRKSSLKIASPLRLMFTCLVLVLAIFMVVAPHYKARATANANNFQAGKIIDDSVFTNYSSMSAPQIQAFLNSKVSSCDTNGTQPATDKGRPDLTHAQYAALMGWPAPPYTCMKDYSENNLSAAQLIYNTAQQYQINPQVLIVLLQKEQGLVTDNWPLPGQYKTATGYACPDGAPCDSRYYGLTNQLNQSGYMFRAIMDSYSAWYTPYVLGNNYVKWHPDAYNSTTSKFDLNVCGGTTVYIQNRATQALYNYTPYQPNAAALAAGYGIGDSCSSHGNRNFYLYFNDWFGSSSYSPPTCDSKLSNVGCVWQLYSPNTDSNFLTFNSSERDTAVSSSNYVYDKRPFYTFTTQQNGTIPVYRVRTPLEHFYTVSKAERDSLLQSTQNIDEGTAFYVYAGSDTTNSSYPVFRLDSSNGHIFTADPSIRDSLINNSGYTYEGIAFNTPSGYVNASDPVQGMAHVYRLVSGVSHIYTTGLAERDDLLSKNWIYESTLLDALTDTTKNPVYRLTLNGDHIFTQSTDEKTNLIAKGWLYEGIGWYIDGSTPPTYRFYSNNNQHFLTSDLSESFKISNNGYRYEGIAFGNTAPGASLPVYRFYDGSGRHFFTSNLNESQSIANRPWVYEGVGWYASTAATTAAPVFRMVDSRSNHFYTTSEAEKNQLLASSTGWVYEGVGWYASTAATTAAPVFRMVDSRSNHFYTTSEAEKNQLLASSTGWVYEGVGWYNL